MLKKSLGLFVGFMMLLTIVPSASAYTGGHISPDLQRLSGYDRYATATAVSQQFEPGVPVAYVATGSNFPDALAAVAAAANLGGPLLLTPKNSVPAGVIDELDRLQPAEIVIVGGANAVSHAVEQQLRSIAQVTRLGGSDRYSTGEIIVRHAFNASDTVFIATGRTFPDALAATGAAGFLSAPVVLVDGKSSKLTASTLALLNDLSASHVYIAGGSSAVSNGIVSQPQSRGYNVNRLGGASRYETAININATIFGGLESTVFLATGTNFPDALAGAALAGQVGAALYVTQPECSPSVLHHHLNGVRPYSTIVLGGTKTVSDAAAYNEICITKVKSGKLTFAQQNAVRTAQDYLRFMHFSRIGLIGQLEYEGYSTQDATFAVDYIYPDWNKQAAGTAKDYLDFMSFSRQGLIDQLLYEGFTLSQAEYGVRAVGY